ncbi:MAG: response regulator transcription factor [Actinobacteria bacterium]|nr:response regulator transcription factor [Actinomycetota bacterium]
MEGAGGSVGLSRRELEVVELVVEGLTNEEIAKRLHLSHRTAQAHVAAAMRKLGARSRTQLAVFALRAALIPLDPGK